MAPTQVVALIVRLFAVFLVAYGLRHFADMAVFLAAGQPVLPRIVIGLLAFFVFGVALVMWRFPLTISTSIVNTADSAQEPMRWSLDELYCLGFVLMGFLFLFWSVSDAILWAIIIASNSVGHQDAFEMVVSDWAAVIATVFEGILALSLIFGANGWKRMVYRFRFGRA